MSQTEAEFFATLCKAHPFEFDWNCADCLAENGTGRGPMDPAVRKKALDTVNRVAALTDGDKDWDTGCCNCEALPTVHPTELCGPCCFGEAATAGGNW